MRICVQTGPHTHEYREVDAPTRPDEILYTGGLGDIFTIESFTPEEVRSRLRGLVLACPMALQIVQMYQALPTSTYPKLTHYEILPSGTRVFYKKSELAAKFPQAADCDDWSIFAKFHEWESPKNRKFIGSSFLKHHLCRSRQISRPYVVVVPHSNWGWWANRGFDEDDWQECLSYLKRQNLLGVIIHSGKEKSRSHPYLLDLTNQTSILEAVELLKHSQGYIGIDSALSVLASQLFPLDKLSVKCVQDHCYRWAPLYYASWTKFPFMVRKLVVPDRR